MKQLLRVYALGLLTATLIFGVYYLFFYEPEIQTVTEVMSEDDMIATLETSGHYIYEDDPLESIDDQQDVDPDDNESDDVDTELTDEEPEGEPNNEEPLEDVETEEPVNDMVTLTIEDGMTVSEVADILVLEEVINSRDELASYLVENNYGTNIQVGQFELHQNMTLAELVETIARPNNE